MTDSMAGPACARAKQRCAEVLPLLRSWVETNSYSANVEGVNEMGDLLAEAFALEGLVLDRRAGDGVGDHLVWTTPAWAGAGDRRLILVGHHDTVFPPGAFETWERDGDRLRGPGVLDMKGGLATAWATVAAFADIGRLAELPLAIVSVGDEEIGSPDSKQVIEELARGAGGALVFEAGRAGDAIITRRKGTGALAVTATGRAAHAGNHHREGVNAIWSLARLIDRAQELTDYDRGVTVNVGLISGGSSRNTVPAEARCDIDFRFIRRADGEALVAAVEALAAELSTGGAGALTVAGGIRRLPLERTDASVALCRRYAECAEAAGLGGVEAGLIGGGSDASTASAVGVAAIDGLGPRGSGFHTHDEVIEVSSLELRVDALARFLARWLAEGPPR